METYLDYVIEETKKILSIDSPGGYTAEAVDYIIGVSFLRIYNKFYFL